MANTLSVRGLIDPVSFGRPACLILSSSLGLFSFPAGLLANVSPLPELFYGCAFSVTALGFGLYICSSELRKREACNKTVSTNRFSRLVEKLGGTHKKRIAYMLAAIVLPFALGAGISHKNDAPVKIKMPKLELAAD